MKKNHRIITGWLTLLALSTLNIQLSIVCAQGLTFTNYSYNVGNSPSCVVAADVNGDGKPDLICANYDDNTLMVLTNNGSGVFGSNATLNVGSEPTSVVAADVNGDGMVDLITANYGTNTLTVLTNNGSGIFGSNATYTVGNGPFNVVAADVNGDGMVDLISANDTDNTLTVLTNNGDGTFSFCATLNVGSNPTVTAADVNGDGILDLICANFGDNTLTVLTNNGSGIFGSNATYTVGNGPFNVVAADVNGDGMVDLISANDTDNTLTVLTNNGDGTFSFCATLNVGSNPTVTAADVNGDGMVDLITANYGTNTLTVLTNNGSGIFGSNATYTVGNSPINVVVADVNGDGMVDLISANQGDNTLTVLMQLQLQLQITTALLPNGTVGTFYSQTLQTTGGQPPYTWSLAPGSANLPPNLTLTTNGVLSGTLVTNGAYSFIVRVTDSTAATADQPLSLTIVLPLRITTASLPNDTNGAFYSQTLQATGGQTPYSWSPAPYTANLPAGLALAANGVLSGTPNGVNGKNVFYVRVTDAFGTTADQLLSIAVIGSTNKPSVCITAATCLGNGRFQFTFNTISGTSYTIQCSTNLLNWISLLTLNGNGRPLTIIDPGAAGNSQRFYRVKCGP